MYIKYLSIPYKHLGRTYEGVDCLGLVQLYYKEELGIVLPDMSYDMNWLKNNPTLITDNYKAFGFVRVDTVKTDSVVIVNKRGVLQHIVVVTKPPYYALHTTLNGTICEYMPNLQSPDNYILEYRGNNEILHR